MKLFKIIIIYIYIFLHIHIQNLSSIFKFRRKYEKGSKRTRGEG